MTIPLDIRERLGLPPETEVEFAIAGNIFRITKAKRPAAGSEPASISSGCAARSGRA